MNPFWKTILTTVLGAASLVGARYSANWIADHTYRANRSRPTVAQVIQPTYARSYQRVTVPNYFRHSSAPRPYRRHTYHSRY
jgi:hypothetical protein